MKVTRSFWFFRITAIFFVLLLIYRCDILFPPDGEDSANTVSDIDGNVYTTVKIGTQEWMVENLKTTRFNDGIPITLKNNLPDPMGEYTTYCWYNDDIAYKKDYGALYNWNSAKNGKLAPAGWHVADYADWLLLFNFLGENSGCKIMEAGSVHWISPSNDCATNETGFTALPAGTFVKFGFFEKMGTGTGWFPSSMRNSPMAYPAAFVLYGKKWSTYETRPNEYFSVRCIKNSVPSVTTAALTDITKSSAIAGGELTIRGGSGSTSRGVCWDTSHNPTTMNPKTMDEFNIMPYTGGWKMTTFKSTITGLQANTTYYLRAYAINNEGIGYGNEITFKTLP